MELFLVVFLLYLIMRMMFRQRQRKVEPILLVGARIAVTVDTVRAISLVGMAGVALVIVILSILGFPLSSDHIANFLTFGVVTLSVQYLPLVLIGEQGISSFSAQMNWKDIVSVNVVSVTASLCRIVVKSNTNADQKSLTVYIQSSSVDSFSKLVEKYSGITVNQPMPVQEKE